MTWIDPWNPYLPQPVFTPPQMSRRDHFAASALQGMLASWYEGNETRLFDFAKVAQDAWDAADAMIASENRTTEGESA